ALKWIGFVPIDITLLSGAGVVAISMWFLLGASKFEWHPGASTILFTTLAFFAWYLFTASYTISESFWIRKASILVLDVIAVAAPLICLRSTRHFEWFDRALQFLAIAA